MLYIQWALRAFAQSISKVFYCLSITNFLTLNSERGIMKKYIACFLIVLFNTFGIDETIYSLNKIDKTEDVFKGDWERLNKQSAAAGVLALGTFGFFYLFRNNIKSWDTEASSVNEMTEIWKKNLSVAPVWDKSQFQTNFLAHPYVGSIYYVAARKSNFSQFESFLYAATLSTFVWEFGIESFVEPPSIQDIIITPIVGSMIGEYLYNLEKMIIANNGKIGDSRLWGKISLAFIDPIGTTANLIGFKDDTVMGFWNFNFDEKGEIEGIGISAVGKF